MLLSDIISSASEGLRRNRMRSLLTTLGITIGVGSVVRMLSVGSSFEAYIEGQLEGISAKAIDVYPKGVERFGMSLDTITQGDADAVARLSTVQHVAPSIFVPFPIRYEGEESKPFTLGTTPGLYINYGIEAEEGRLMSDLDQKGAKFVAVLGPETAEDLFENESAVGKRVTIGTYKFTVIGVTKSKGSLTGQDMDKMVTIPLSVAKSITGQDYMSYITLQAVGDVDLAMDDIRLLLRQRHKIDNPDDDHAKDAFLARSTEQATEILGTVTMSLTVFLALIAGISLVVGGIGIMNIMLVSVTERTKEIGLRKAVGASRRDILLQFLYEAVFLTGLGGTIGILGGMGLAYLLASLANSYLGDFPFAISWTAVILSLFMAFGTGILFGIYPAKKAAALSPMEALRFE